jgi:hypothetical protein
VYSLDSLTDALADSNLIGGGEEEFRFSPGPPTQSGDDGLRRQMEPTEIRHLHVKMQRDLYTKLVADHGSDSVATEQRCVSGRPADVVVQLPDRSVEMYEIKTALSPRDCVRQALGQLLEYAYWPGGPTCQSVWVVGPSLIDRATESYLSLLRDQFTIPIGYLQVETG